jgi:hypothetical protein
VHVQPVLDMLNHARAGQIDATRVDPAGGFGTMRTIAPPTGRGWEWMAAGPGAGCRDWDAEIDTIPGLLGPLRTPRDPAGRQGSSYARVEARTLITEEAMTPWPMSLV